MTLLESFPCGPVDTNAILLGCERTGRAAIIDAPVGSAAVLIPRLKELSLSAEMLLLTHSHQDHIAEAARLKRELHIPVYLHPLDTPNLEFPGADQLPSFIEVEPLKPDQLLSDGQKIPLGELELTVLHTPGHTPGGVCFYLEAEHLLLSGDTLFQGTMGRIDFPLSNPGEMWRSLKRLALLPADTRVVPGHGGNTTIGREAIWMSDAQRRFSDDS